MNNETKQTRKKLSIFRLALLVGVICVISYGTSESYQTLQANGFAPNYEAWFAAYVDVTSTPFYAFENRTDDLKKDAILSFIVADPENPCVPTWGTHYDLNEAKVALDLDRRIARLQQQGGRIAISFGGALNSELALVCTDEEALYTGYRAVIDRYNVNTIDLDLESESLKNREAGQRRARVIARLQANYQKTNHDLAVWLTLPVTPQGLTKDGTDTIGEMLASGVNLSGINVMVMDYGESKNPKDTMYEASRLALLETYRQLGILYATAGINLHSSSIWKKIGATPMIGQNDIVKEVFTTEDAEKLNEFANKYNLGRMSMWSANRDLPCGENYVDVRIVSDVCSGVKAPADSFTKILSAGFSGDLSQSAPMLTEEYSDHMDHIVDDPTTSPYPVWQPAGVYLKGTKVVWRGNVYEAKWWTKDDQPDNPTLQSWELPWQLIGPVLPGEKPVPQPRLPKDTYPQWSGRSVYEGGERVLFEGLPYQAKWWNQGESPAVASLDPDSSPWIPLSYNQVMEILKTQR